MVRIIQNESRSVAVSLSTHATHRNRFANEKPFLQNANLSSPQQFPALDANMEHLINLHIEKLPEGVYLATSDEMPGLVAQGRTIQETLEIARDVGRKLIEARTERSEATQLPLASDSFDYPLVVSG
ncbi:MAG: type II toxin-antitoxin system HicB family antitoxin [Wenzhouxiangellaceae bacterium]|nr:type II toxin-antitoxin system HicB family antitoxin [Wenzhouxiangellaceae bacterium]